MAEPRQRFIAPLLEQENMHTLRVARAAGAYRQAERIVREMEPAEREAHTAEGRALKESIARVEEALARARTAFEDALSELPNFVHPDVP